MSRSTVFLFIGIASVFHSLNAQTGPVQGKVTTLGCGTTFGCMRNPPNCSSPECQSLVKWKNSETPGYLDVELMAKTSGWVALGLSLDSAMGNDSVSHCTANSSNGNDIEIGLSWNTPSPNKNNIVLGAPEVTTPLINRTGSYVDGEVHCRFSRRVASDGDRIYALNSKYYLLLGYGDAINGAKKYHNRNPIMSPKEVDVTKDIVNYYSDSGDTGGSQAGGSQGLLTDASGNQVLYALTADKKNVEFTMRRTLSSPSANEWVALGFSTDQIMKDDSVVECAKLPDGTVVARSSYNQYHDNNQGSSPINIGIISPQYSNIGGVIECKFQRPVTGVNHPQVYDLNVPYYPLLASGGVDSAGKKMAHTAYKALPDMINFSDGKATNATAGSGGRCEICMKRAHGILMITAWVLIVSTSIIVARYYKTCWPEKKLCTTAVWFSLHRFLMLLALACTIAAFIIIFVVNKGKLSNYKEGSPTYFWVHAPMGIVVMILVILNPLMAAFRCHPNTRFRPIFNWLHWFVGTCAHVVALITIFFGIKIGELSDVKICHMAVFWIMIAFVGFHVLIEIILSLDKCIAETRSKRSFQVQYEMSKPGEVPRVLEPTVGSCSVIFRYFVLAFYFMVVLGLWLGMVILIGSGKID